MRFSLLPAVVAGLCLAACGGTDTTAATPTTAAPAATTAPTAPAGWVDADLSATPAKLPLVVQAPAGYTLAKSPMDGAELTSEAVTFDVDDVSELGPTRWPTRKPR